MVMKYIRMYEGYDNNYKVGDYVYYYGNFNISNVVKIMEISNSNDSYRVNVIRISGESGTESLFFTWVGKFMIKGKASEEAIAEYKRLEDEIKMKDDTNKYNL